MRLHETLDACIAYIAFEGFLDELHEHLLTLDDSIDGPLLNHTFALLSRLPNVQVLLTASPIGEGRIATTAGHEHNAETPLVQVLDGDDDGGDPPVRRNDLAGLLARYGGRVRVRVREDEVYFRLTGSHQKVSRITAPVLHTLQLIAQSREEGIMSTDLGLITRKDQRSVFYNIKVLENLNLVSKVTVTHQAASANLIILNQFKDRNDTFRAAEPYEEPDAADPSFIDGDKHEAVAEDAVNDDDMADEGGGSKTQLTSRRLGLNFSPFSESELSMGHLPRQRLKQILEHPNLDNHLLRMQNLLSEVGWVGEVDLRRRRTMIRHAMSLVETGVAERFSLEPNRYYMRLVEFKPGYVPSTVHKVDLVESDLGPSNAVPLPCKSSGTTFRSQLAVGAGPPLATRFHLGETTEHQMVTHLDAHGKHGSTMLALYNSLSYPYRRMLETILNRLEGAYALPHLSHLALCGNLEQVSRERRLRIYTIPHLRAHLRELNQEVDNERFPPAATIAQRWADVAYRHVYTDANSRDELADKIAGAPFDFGTIKQYREGTVQRRPRVPKDAALPNPQPSGPAKVGRPRKAEAPGARALANGRVVKYGNDTQERGRPRKYVFIVDPTGKRLRNVVGNLLNAPGLPEVLIWYKTDKLLVPAPPGYTGVGAAPDIPRDVIEAQGKAPSFYAKYPQKATGKVKTKGKGKKNKASEDEDEDNAELDEKADEDEDGDAGADANVDVSIAPARAGQKRGADPESSTSAAKRVAKHVDQKGGRDAVLAAESGIAAVPSGDGPSIGDKRAASPVADSLAPPPTKRTRGRPRKQVEADQSTTAGEVAQKKRGRPRKDQPLPTGPKSTPESSATAANVPTSGGAPDATRAGPALDSIEEQPPAVHDKPVTELANAEPVDDDSMVGRASKAGGPASKAGETDHQTVPPITMRAAPDTSTVPAADDASSSRVPAMDREVESTASREAAVGMDISAHNQDRVGSPLVEVQATDVRSQIAEAAPKREVRPNFTAVLRMNAILQCLRDHGGILERNEYRQKYREWVQRYAGTDHPHAPAAATSIDGKVFDKSCVSLVDDERLKQRATSLSTTTGRWVHTVFYATPESTQEVQDGYMRTFVVPSNANDTVPRRGPHDRREESQVSVDREETPARPRRVETQRERIMRETNAAAINYGWRTGRNMRVLTLFRAIVRAMAIDPHSRSVVSHSPRVFSMSLLFESLAVGDYLACIRKTDYDEGLWQWLQQPGNRDVRLCDVPVEFDIGRNFASMRSLLATLVALRLLDPLVPVAADGSQDNVIVCEDGGATRAFELTADVDKSVYFIAYEWAPVYHIAIGEQAPALGVMPARTYEEADSLLYHIKRAALAPRVPPMERHAIPPFPERANFGGVLDVATSLHRLLRGPTLWVHRPPLSAEQRRNLEAILAGTDQSEDLLRQVAYDNAVEFAYVKRAVEQRQEKAARQAAGDLQLAATGSTAHAMYGANGHALEAEQARRKQQHQADRKKITEQLANGIAAAAAALEQQIRDVAQSLEVAWSTAVREYVLTKRRRPEMGKTTSDEEIAMIIRSYVRQADMPRRVGAIHAKPKSRSIAARASGRARNTHDWTPDDEERLFEGEAIIRARVRDKIRRSKEGKGKGHDNYGHAALVSLFPGMLVQALYTRVKKMKARPGREAYMQRLTEAWYDVWVAHRGVDLPDDDFDDHVNFDIAAHVDFLRDKLDRRMLRLSSAPTARVTVDLPMTVGEIEAGYHWQEESIKQPVFQTIWTSDSSSEEARVTQVVRQSFVHMPDWDVKPAITTDEAILGAAIQMVVATPDATFDTAAAARLLGRAPKRSVEAKINELVAQDVITRLPDTSSRYRSRMYAYSSSYEDSRQGPIPPDALVEAAQLQKTLAAQGQIEWPLVGQLGDLLAAMDLVTNQKVHFKCGPAPFLSSLSRHEMYNTRRRVDEDLECKMQVLFIGDAPAVCPADPPRSDGYLPLVPWHQGPGRAVPDLYNVSQDVIDKVVQAIDETGADGLTISECQARTGFDGTVVKAVLADAADGPRPVFWAGYDTARIVMRPQWRRWTVQLRKEDGNREIVYSRAPRRWLDLWGGLIETRWEEACVAVSSTVRMNPGIDERNLRDRLHVFFDRLELNDVLQALLDAGLVTRSRVRDTADLPSPVQATDVADEHNYTWLPVIWA